MLLWAFFKAKVGNISQILFIAYAINNIDEVVGHVTDVAVSVTVVVG